MLRSQDEILQKQIVNAIETARREAIAQYAGVVLALDKNQKILIFVDEYADARLHEQAQLVSSMQLQHGQVELRAFHLPLIFMPSGLMNNDNASFLHSHEKGLVWSISLSKSGRTRLAYSGKLD